MQQQQQHPIPHARAGALSTEKTIYDFTVSDIDGNDVKLDKYKGKVLMVVNVASKCGNTPQYKVLEDMYKQYSDKGFVILGLSFLSALLAGIGLAIWRDRREIKRKHTVGHQPHPP